MRSASPWAESRRTSPVCAGAANVRGEVEARFNRYTPIDDRIREIIRLGESSVLDNADRLTACLVLATEERP